MSTDPVTRFILNLRQEADAADFSGLTERAVPRSRKRVPIFALLRTRVAFAAALVVVALGSFGGVSYAANGAAPGDFLYGLDRALERVGIGNGGASERITEAFSLVSSGHPAHGLEHAATVVPDEAGGRALQEAAINVPASADFQVEVFEEDVLALLSYLKENVGHIDGATVAEYAREIGKPADTPGNGAPEDIPGNGPPEGTPGDGPPEDTPGNGPPTTTTTIAP